MISKSTNKSTSSPESPDGPSPSSSQDGLKTDLSGQSPAPAPRSQTQESKRLAQAARAECFSRALSGLDTFYALSVGIHGWPTSATSGRQSGPSSPSASLQLSLESRLQARMAGYGSPEYVLRWKNWDMLSGPPICALRGSAPRTSGKGCSGWPTPQAEGVAKTRDLTKRVKKYRQTRDPTMLVNT